MWSFFAFLFGSAYVGGRLVHEEYQKSKARAYSDAVMASNVVRHAPRGGLWQSMIQPYPSYAETDGYTWGYQHPKTKEWYEDFNFKTTAHISDGGMTEALERHRNLARYDKVYAGVFTYYDSATRTFSHN